MVGQSLVAIKKAGCFRELFIVIPRSRLYYQLFDLFILYGYLGLLFLPRYVSLSVDFSSSVLLSKQSVS